MPYPWASSDFFHLAFAGNFVTNEGFDVPDYRLYRQKIESLTRVVRELALKSKPINQ
jgi:hypothetical protein